MTRCLNCGRERKPPSGHSPKAMRAVYFEAWERDEFCSRGCCEEYLAAGQEPDESSADDHEQEREHGQATVEP